MVLAFLVSLSPLTVLAVPSRAPAQDAAGLVALCVDGYGGQAAIAAVSAFVQVGAIVTAGGAGEPGRLFRAFHRPDRLRVEIDRPDRDPEVRVLVGDRGWRAGRPVGGPLHQAMVLQAVRLDLGAFLLAAPEQVSEAKPVLRDGTEYRVLVLAIGEGLTMSAEIHPETGRVHRTIGRIPMEGAPRPLEFVNVYSDYREVNGVWFAFRETTYAQGRHTSDITLKEVRTYDVLPEEHFDPGLSVSEI